MATAGVCAWGEGPKGHFHIHGTGSWVYSPTIESLTWVHVCQSAQVEGKSSVRIRGVTWRLFEQGSTERPVCFVLKLFYETVLGAGKSWVRGRGGGAECVEEEEEEGEVRKGLILVSMLRPGCPSSAELVLGVVLVQKFDVREGKVAALAFTFTLPLAVHVYFGHLHQVTHLQG